MVLHDEFKVLYKLNRKLKRALGGQNLPGLYLCPIGGGIFAQETETALQLSWLS